MGLSKRTFEVVLDLLENKISCMEGWDQATARERSKLEACRRELLEVQGRERSDREGGRSAVVIDAFPDAVVPEPDAAQ